MDAGLNLAAPPTVMAPPPTLTPQELVAATWGELGYKIRPLFAKVFVRTEPPMDRVGLIYLPAKYSDFFGGLAHQKMVTAVVLSVGPLAKLVKPGERVCFARLQFGHIAKLPDRSYVGWIEQEQLAGYPADDFRGSLEGMTA